MPEPSRYDPVRRYDAARTIRDHASRIVKLESRARPKIRQSYTPTWRGTTGSPTIGNGSLVGSYQEIGELVHVKIQMTLGSTSTTTGVGAWILGLPFDADYQIGPDAIIGSAMAWDDSVSAWYPGISVQRLSDGFSPHGVCAALVSAGARTGASTPFAWTTNDILYIETTYVRV